MEFKVNDKVRFVTTDEFNGLTGHVEEAWYNSMAPVGNYNCWVDHYESGSFSFDESELIHNKEDLFSKLYETLKY